MITVIDVIIAIMIPKDIDIFTPLYSNIDDLSISPELIKKMLFGSAIKSLARRSLSTVSIPNNLNHYFILL